MKRVLLALALGAGLFACSESEIFGSNAGLAGTYDLTIVGPLVFVTSSDRDELRVLDLDSSPRDYVRAPNPLEALSIPVLDRPLALARDVQYNAKGEEVAGPYVYARSAGSQEISVVGADRAQLRERRRLVAPGLVTAIAARGPATTGGLSQLFYATQSSAGAQVWVQDLPAPDALTSEAVLTPPRTVLPLAAGETVQALLALPPADPVANPGENTLVVATRRGTGQTGRTLRVDVNAPDQFVELRFGAPVRALATHPRVFRVTNANVDPQVEEQLLTPGQRIYGILDESSCGALAGCSGVLAVERSTGDVVRDATNQPMVPITVGAALPTGLTLAANAQLLVTTPDGGKVIDRLPLLAILPASNGEITLFDALQARHFDFDRANASSVVELRDVAEVVKTTGRSNVLTATVVNGATRTDIYRVIYQGILPNLSGVGRTAEVTAPFEVGRTTAERAAVRAGDIITLESDAGACSEDLTVTQVTAGPGAESVTLLTDRPTPEACGTFPRFTVRAGGNQPFVVTSETLGYLARMAPGETYTRGGTYFYHPDGFDPNVAPVQVGLTLEPTQDPKLVRGDRYVIVADGHFVPFIARVNNTDASVGLTTYRLPASVIYAVGNDGIDYAYIAYPSADGILQVNLEGLFFEVTNATNLRNFE